MADPLMLEPEFAPHYNAWKTEPSPENTQHLVKALDPVLNSAIKSYAGSSIGSPTIKGKAKLIAINALKSYDPTRAKLRTHMMSQLQGLRRASAKETQILSIPEQVAIELGKVNEATNFLTDRLGRPPSDAELADHTGLSLKRLHYIRGVRPTYAEGTIANVRGDEGQSLYAPQVDQPDSYKAWEEFVYHDLEPIDQLIMEHSLGLHNKPVLSNQDIAKKLKVSPGAISQRKAKIQSKLDLRDELSVL